MASNDRSRSVRRAANAERNGSPQMVRSRLCCWPNDNQRQQDGTSSQTVATASGPHEQVQKKSPLKAGSLPLPPPAVHLEQSDVMGDTEFESVTSAV